MRLHSLFCGYLRPGRLPGRLIAVSCLPLCLMAAALGCREDTESPSGPEPAPAFATTVTSALAFWQVSAGIIHTCGVTTDYRLYCWGNNFNGQLGDGYDH